MDRLVWIDPEGFLDHDWMMVLVEQPTGVSYRHQYGGTACRQATVQGYLVPVFSRVAFNRLRHLFEEALQGAGTWNYRWTDDERAEVRASVALLRMSPSVWTDHPDDLVNLSLDEGRFTEADEAWLPVVSADGPGWLLWPNSD